MQQCQTRTCSFGSTAKTKQVHFHRGHITHNNWKKPHVLRGDSNHPKICCSQPSRAHSQSALITMWCSQSRSWCSAGPHTYKWGRTGWECGGWSHHEAEKCRKEKRKKPLPSSGTCLEQQPAIRPWKSPGTQAVSQRSPPLSSVIVQPSKQEIKAWWQETCMVEQTETKKWKQQQVTLFNLENRRLSGILSTGYVDIHCGILSTGMWINFSREGGSRVPKTWSMTFLSGAH